MKQLLRKPTWFVGFLNSIFYHLVSLYGVLSNPLLLSISIFLFYPLHFVANRLHTEHNPLHVVLVFPNRAPFLSNDTVAQAWKHGFVKVTAIDNVDNVGAYLTAYLGNMELKEFRAAFGSNAPAKDTCTAKGYDENGKPVSKRIVKGARMALYPSQFHLFRKSKGIKLPTVERVRAEKADAFFTDITLTYEKTVLLEDVDSGFRSLINTRYYNTKRKQEKGAAIDSQRIVGCIPAVVHGEQVKTDHHIRLHGEH